MKVKFNQIETLSKMKTIQLKFKTFLLLLLVGFAFASCSKDDDEVENRPPNSFTLNEVANAEDLQPKLTWETATDPDGDDVSYQVYFDTENPPQITIANQLAISSFTIENALETETTYYWKVIAKDTEGNTTESDISSFTSRDMTSAEAIVGKWFFGSIAGEQPLTACQKNSFFLFSAELFLKIEQYDEDSNGDCVEIVEVTGTYEVVSDDQIKITRNSGTQTIEIQSLTDTELIIVDTGGTIYTLLKQ